MFSKQKQMLFVYHLPGFFAVLRTVVTLWFFFVNPFNLPLRYIQWFVLVVYAVVCFSYYKLYSDGVPVISVIAPTLIHMVIIFAFMRMLVIIPFLVLGTTDILFLTAKSIKASLYPFDTDDDDDDMSLFDDAEFSQDAE